MDVIRLETADRPARLNEAASEGSRILPNPEILSGLDALRAFAALAVVMLHAGVPYLNHPMPGLIWPVAERGSNLIDVFVWGIQVFIMPLFLVIAGFLLHRSAERLSPKELLVSRAKRLLLPLLAASLLILPLDLFVWTLGLITQGLIKATKLRNYSFDAPISDQIWGLAHLWFLLYLFLFALCVTVGLSLRHRFRWGNARFHRLGLRGLGLRGLGLMVGLVAVATLSLVPEVVWGFQHSFLPVPSKWLYCGCFFAAGWLLSHWDRNLTGTFRISNRLLAVGMVLLAGSVTLGIWRLEQHQAGRDIDLASDVVLSVLTTSAAAAITFGLLGMAVHRIRRVPRPVRYVASASFWIYIVHQPVVGIVHLDFYQSWPSGPAIVKLGVSFLVGIVFSLLLFEAFVRNGRLASFVGFKHLAPRVTENASTSLDEPEIKVIREYRRAA